MRKLKTLLPSLAGTDRPVEHVLAMKFLLDLTSTTTAGTPPAGVTADRIDDADDADLGAVLDDCCAICAATWPQHLDGFLDGVAFSAKTARENRKILDAVGGLPWSDAATSGRYTQLADLYQWTRSLSTKQWQGAFFTPWHVASLITTMNEVALHDWVIDPACGGGVFLLAALESVRARHGTRLADTVTLIGVELDPRTCQIARASLLIAGAHPDQFFIAHGDALSQAICGRDRSDHTLKTLRFGVVLANPPFGKGSRTASAGEPLIVPDRVLYRPVPVGAVPAGAEAA